MHSFERGAVVAVCLLAGLGAGEALGQVNVNLHEWEQQGPNGSGNWIVADDGLSVLQTINGAPTYFVSTRDYYNTTVRGSFGVETTSDDDFIGFVFGFQGPIADEGHPPLMVDYLLFDWKQRAQSGASPGFRLSYMQGSQSGSTGAGTPMWRHESDALLTVQPLASDMGTSRGWANNTRYQFELLYQQDRIAIDIEGGTGDFQTRQRIFDVSLAEVDPDGTLFGGAFPEGRFGFYNYSQERVRYESFTEQADPALGLSSDTLTFGLVRVGDSAQGALTISNTGGTGAATLGGSIDAASDPFASLDGAGFTLNEGESADRTFSFSPTMRGDFGQQLSLTSNAPFDGDAVISLAGTGVGPTFSSDTAPGTTLDLGVAEGGEALDVLLTVLNVTGDENGGNDDLTDLTLDFTITGDNAALFAVDLVAGTRINKAGELDIVVSFVGGDVEGTYGALLTLLTDEGAALGATGVGQAYQFDLAAVVVPEPTTAALVGMGVVGLLRRRR